MIVDHPFSRHLSRPVFPPLSDACSVLHGDDVWLLHGALFLSCGDPPPLPNVFSSALVVLAPV